MFMVRWFLLGCIVCACGFLAGCSKVQPVAVNGEVLLDGKPMSEGEISLVAEDGSGADVFEVKDGKFQGQSKPGKKKVEIRKYKIGEATKMADKVIEGTKENILPAKYNTETTMKAEVTATGIAPPKFETTSQ
jgi:hypothetical protein